MFNRGYFVLGYFPSVWFAPADEEHLTPDELAPEYHGGGKKQGQARHDLTVEEVQKQWELFELRTRTEAADVAPALPAQPVESTPADQIPIKNEEPVSATVSGNVTLARPGNYQGILTSSPAIGSPIDAAFMPLSPDKANAAIEAKRKANNDALLAILMEL